MLISSYEWLIIQTALLVERSQNYLLIFGLKDGLKTDARD